MTPLMDGWKISRLDGEPTPKESREIEDMLAACLGLLNEYSLKQATAFILKAPAMYEALKRIAKHSHNRYNDTENSQYDIGVTDGHRCAAKVAISVLEDIQATI